MYRDIEPFVQRCETCQRHRYQQPKEPMRPHDKPQEPWSKVGMEVVTEHRKTMRRNRRHLLKVP
ncbi:hypothetical protein N1851_034162 [Merluccius polli]|uniref:Integrase zinc-binding domain-containing protein n=1 Tax=Merluccius polli TaxID=89951 RepID=A0AA47M019_MERPO|nr:hypothetical protein N1851_034162 [Merluccius polli]